jgi:hypothetical protein
MTCANTATDPNNCGTCGNRCATLGTCSGSACSCPVVGSTTTKDSVCNNRCTDTLDDPNNCGACGTFGGGTGVCNQTQYCAGNGTCQCRPGLTAVGGFCVDLNSSPTNCGKVGTVCAGATPNCDGGVCKAACTGGRQRCATGGGGLTGACVDTQTDALNCGGCGTRVNNNQVCIQGNPVRYAPAIGCTTANITSGVCASCPTVLGGFGGGGGTYRVCPGLGSEVSPICVQGNRCP